MNLKDIPVPEVYKESADFRFFLNWFGSCLEKIQYDIENLYDLYDALKCPSWLLWMLGDTVGYRYDDRLPCSFNRLVILYFMSLIRNKGSKDGVTLAAELNLAQFNIINQGKLKDILNNRVDDTSIPVNSVYVTPHTSEGYIDVVYFSENVPIDACIEYVRPLGMYLFQYSGVRCDSRTKISIDARLTNTNDMYVGLGPTHVGHYRRADYARMQKMLNEPNHEINRQDDRHSVYYRNSKAEKAADPNINPGYRALYSLQLCNNVEIVKSMIPSIFDLGYQPQLADMQFDIDYISSDKNPNYMYNDRPVVNLRYNKPLDDSFEDDIHVVDESRTVDSIHPQPAVNPRVVKLGDAISMNDTNTSYTHVNKDNEIELGDGKY